MDQSKFSLSWEDYKGNICRGFSSLQQNGEFVDMTLAADGHLVKVHQMLIALASPYFKELLASIPCKHPVIFLNNISHDTLCSLLEYIYTGQVIVQAENLTKFFDTAKALHIKGLYEMNINDMNGMQTSTVTEPQNTSKYVNEDYGATRIYTDFANTLDVPKTAKRVKLSHESEPPIKKPYYESNPKYDNDAFHQVIEDDDDDDDNNKDDNNQSTESMGPSNKSTSAVQYTVSTRGALQVILNRYIYNLHSTSARAGCRRWRCVDYRNNKCTAIVTTKGNIVYNRANLHNHPYHDKRILQKN